MQVPRTLWHDQHVCIVPFHYLHLYSFLVQHPLRPSIPSHVHDLDIVSLRLFTLCRAAACRHPCQLHRAAPIKDLDARHANQAALNGDEVPRERILLPRQKHGHATVAEPRNDERIHSVWFDLHCRGCGARRMPIPDSQSEWDRDVQPRGRWRVEERDEAIRRREEQRERETCG